MFCPRCGGRTEVSEKRGVFRDRLCINPTCSLEFTTRENIMSVRAQRRLCARTRATQLDPPGPAAKNRQARSASAGG